MLDIWYRVKTAKAHQKNREMKGAEREYLCFWVSSKSARDGKNSSNHY